MSDRNWCSNSFPSSLWAIGNSCDKFVSQTVKGDVANLEVLFLRDSHRLINSTKTIKHFVPKYTDGILYNIKTNHFCINISNVTNAISPSTNALWRFERNIIGTLLKERKSR